MLLWFIDLGPPISLVSRGYFGFLCVYSLANIVKAKSAGEKDASIAQ